jgi:hypothetical protein
MAHWAEVDENNIVLRVTVGSNEDPDEGYQWLLDNLGGTWIKTSYNATIRKNFASIGYKYDSERDAFIPPMPPTTISDTEIAVGTKEVTWTLNEDTCQWEIID